MSGLSDPAAADERHQLERLLRRKGLYASYLAFAETQLLREQGAEGQGAEGQGAEGQGADAEGGAGGVGAEEGARIRRAAVQLRAKLEEVELQLRLLVSTSLRLVHRRPTLLRWACPQVDRDGRHVNRNWGYMSRAGLYGRDKSHLMRQIEKSASPPPHTLSTGASGSRAPGYLVLTGAPPHRQVRGYLHEPREQLGRVHSVQAVALSAPGARARRRPDGALADRGGCPVYRAWVGVVLWCCCGVRVCRVRCGACVAPR